MDDVIEQSTADAAMGMHAAAAPVLEDDDIEINEAAG